MLVIVLLTVTLSLSKTSVFVVTTVVMLFPLFVIVVLDPPFWPCMGIKGSVAAVAGVGSGALFTAVAGVGSGAPDTALSLEVG